MREGDRERERGIRIRIRIRITIRISDSRFGDGVEADENDQIHCWMLRCSVSV